MNCKCSLVAGNLITWVEVEVEEVEVTVEQVEQEEERGEEQILDITGK